MGSYFLIGTILYYVKKMLHVGFLTAVLSRAGEICKYLMGSDQMDTSSCVRHHSVTSSTGFCLIFRVVLPL